MFHFTAFLIVIAAFAGAASAVSCTPAETYCGSRLIKANKRNRAAVEDALISGRQPIDEAHIKQSVFWCAPAGVPVPAKSGLLFVTYCGPVSTCVEGGALGGVGDACVPSTSGGRGH
ncbi:hypothetical protein CGRA01v4_01658 [Colletotrichum graminicola]|uniref:Uncharacterized protein n=1 Tax=Colletotrichum graminicola (strain M1.001 / M2 / FGSC 10212) TaxID=645133 RepID=E3QVD2_COLGM|nr:uncharacterized protein GLRG_09964 [Colletotrichum graminicola M1.001]EFQ34820.1 hypothetical protein GLRG_09964 [Colletotrichum graminicola M1.001]WDK10379.1 hypothetical protein CGRA01v4_01658 [Colletotrichum graminicola]